MLLFFDVFLPGFTPVSTAPRRRVRIQHLTHTVFKCPDPSQLQYFGGRNNVVTGIAIVGNVAMD